jgi:hypothetical protein
MRTFALSLAVGIALAGQPKAARAEGPVGVSGASWGENPSREYQSSQWFALELKFGPYSPNIDASPGLNGNTPFQDVFTSQFDTPHKPGPKLLTTVEFDFQFLHKHGSLGVGASVGIYSRYSHAFNYANMAGTVSCVVPMCTRSGDVTSLYILPLELLAVYRWDWLALRYNVPLVPYFKTGLAYYIWWITAGNGSVSQYTNPSTGQTEKGYGGTFGWVLEPGISFLLDVLDPSAAKTMDAELGINHAYLFFELHYANITGFGQSNRLVLSDTTWNTGIAFEF